MILLDPSPRTSGDTVEDESEEEIETLERYGAQFEGLLNGKWTPKTENQRLFVEAARGERSPETLFERVWAKYVWRVNWERMRSAVWGERDAARRGSMTRFEWSAVG